MNREIKFRAWDKKVKVFHYWDSNTLQFDSIFWTIVKNDSLNAEEYTGLLDKSGKEIYEGDIIQMKLKKPKEGAIINTLVSFENGIFVYVPYRSKTIKNPNNWNNSHDFHKSNWWGSIKGFPLCKGFYGYGDTDIMEVIGNVHQNPDMI